ncbi:MAG TPA: hypothetical protein PLV45_06590 [bacterium]|nr:hypothetical protein [bacterium]
MTDKEGRDAFAGASASGGSASAVAPSLRRVAWRLPAGPSVRVRK